MLVKVRSGQAFRPRNFVILRAEFGILFNERNV